MQGVCWPLYTHYLIESSQQPRHAGVIIILILQIQDLSLREGKQLA